MLVFWHMIVGYNILDIAPKHLSPPVDVRERCYSNTPERVVYRQRQKKTKKHSFQRLAFVRKWEGPKSKSRAEWVMVMESVHGGITILQHEIHHTYDSSLGVLLTVRARAQSL